MLAARADALLRVGRAAELGHRVGGVDGVQEDGLELGTHRVFTKMGRTGRNYRR